MHWILLTTKDIFRFIFSKVFMKYDPVCTFEVEDLLNKGKYLYMNMIAINYLFVSFNKKTIYFSNVI